MTSPMTPNLQPLLLVRHRHQESASSGAGATVTEYPYPYPDPNPITPPPTPTATPTIAFNVLKAKCKAPPRKKPDPDPNPNPIATAAGCGNVIPPCTECGKRFSSWKALFGHMRCHPERQWRGINPPAQFRRHGPCLGPGLVHVGPHHGHFSSEEYEVAASLILLASGRGPCGLNIGMGWEHHQHHTCGVCLKGFSSGQALGGHMRCHWDNHRALLDHDNHDCGSSRECAFDLNLPPPPPVAAPDASSVGVVLDLRLGM